MSFLAPKAPTPPPPPPPPANPPQMADASVRNAAAQTGARAVAAEGAGFAGTLLTGGQGAAAPPTATKSLLGQ